MKKASSFIKNNWYYLLLIIPLVNIFIVNRHSTNDIWFLLNNGRYVLNHGIPYVEPFTIHEGLNYVMQQWLSSVIFYFIYHKLGGYGLLTFTLLFSLVIMIVYYKLCYLVSKNKLLSVIITVIVFTFSRKYFVFRPQIFTYIIFILELLCMEKHIKNDNGKYLIWMPILSLLLINLHASMWLLQFVFMLPILCNSIFIKNITVDKIKFKPLLFAVIGMAVVGFINPYGYKAITFVFNSYNISEINELVNEMMPLTIEGRTGKLVILSLLGTIVLCNYYKKNRLDVRHYLLLCGTALLAFMHDKCAILFMLYDGYAVSYLLKDLKIKNIKNKYFVAVKRGIVFSSSVFLIITLVYSAIILYINYDFKSVSIVELTDYILDNYDNDKVILFTDYEYGGYTEFMGLKSYMDPRAEVFHGKLNKKENILAEALKLEKADDEYYSEFVKKYNFTHIVVNNYLYNFINYLKSDDNYVLEYEQKTQDGEISFVSDYLFVRKDISIK